MARLSAPTRESMERGLEARATLRLHADRSLRLAAISDTHSLPHPGTDAQLARLAPDAILHGGDIGDLAVLDHFGKMAPLLAVRGNIDTRAAGIPDRVVIDLSDGAETVFRILLLHYAVRGPRLLGEVARHAQKLGAQLVVCGHSHIPFIGRDRGMTVFNPGSIGPRRPPLPIVFGTIDVTATGVKLQHVECETGKVWTP
jgi:putative phosphoesterase